MKCRCPACGRTTRIESDQLDFFSRCIRCGILLRAASDPPSMTSPDPSSATPPGLRVKIVRTGCFRDLPLPPRHHLADVLSRPMKAPPRSPAQAESAPAAPPAPPAQHRRRTARLAELQRHHHTLGLVSLCGTGLTALLAVCALALKVQILFHPNNAAAHTLPAHATPNTLTPAKHD